MCKSACVSVCVCESLFVGPVKWNRRCCSEYNRGPEEVATTWQTLNPLVGRFTLVSNNAKKKFSFCSFHGKVTCHIVADEAEHVHPKASS